MVAERIRLNLLIGRADSKDLSTPCADSGRNHRFLTAPLPLCTVCYRTLGRGAALVRASRTAHQPVDTVGRQRPSARYHRFVTVGRGHSPPLSPFANGRRTGSSRFVRFGTASLLPAHPREGALSSGSRPISAHHPWPAASATSAIMPKSSTLWGEQNRGKME